MTPVDADQHRRRAEEFIGALDLEYYQHFSGQKEVCDFTAIYDRFPELFTKQTIDELEADYKTYKGEDAASPGLSAGLHGRRLHGRPDQGAHRRDRQRREPGDHRGRRRGHRPAPGEHRAGQRGRPRASPAHPGRSLGGHRGGPQPASGPALAHGPRPRPRARLRRLHVAVLRGQGHRLPHAARPDGGLPAGHGGHLRTLARQARLRQDGPRLVRAALVGPALSVAGGGVRPRVHRRAPAAHLHGDARRHGHRPGGADQRAHRRRAA